MGTTTVTRGAQLGCGVGQAQAVVAGRGGDDGTAGILLERRRHGGQAAAHLEGPGGLDRLQLDRHRGAQLGGAHHRRHRQEAAHHLPRRLAVGRAGELHVAHRASLAEAGLAC